MKFFCGSIINNGCVNPIDASQKRQAVLTIQRRENCCLSFRQVNFAGSFAEIVDFAMEPNSQIR
jgi:hypothetical protein